jgi:hypothetical protein
MNGNRDELTTGQTRDLLGALQAIRSVMGQLDRKAALAVWNVAPAKRDSLILCIMEAAKEFSDTIEECKKKQGPGGGQGPNCGPGFHEEFGICVPNN